MSLQEYLAKVKTLLLFRKNLFRVKYIDGPSTIEWINIAEIFFSYERVQISLWEGPVALPSYGKDAGAAQRPFSATQTLA